LKNYSIKSLLPCAFLIFLTVQVQAQNLDSLYTKFVAMHAHKTGIQQRTSGSVNAEKCATELAFSIKHNLPKYSLEKQTVLNSILSRPVLSSTIVSPSGKFTIHYDATGYNAPSYSMSDLAIALDSAYAFEIGFLGFPAPPINSSVDPDGRYHVYVTDLSNVYGYTTPEDEVTTGSHTYTSYISIHNSFSGFYTEGIDAARVTVAHEFHHAIQLGNYYVRETQNNDIEDLFFYEMTSTSMEEFVYNSLNDYYAYLSTFFRNTSLSMVNHNGYDYILWNLYLKNKFGYGIIKRQWELLNKYRAIVAIYNSIAENSSSFTKEFSEFAKWCFYTGYRGELKDYFPEADNYPTLSYYLTKNFTASTISSFSIEPCSFAPLCYVYGTANDTVVVLATNSNVAAAAANPDSAISGTFQISTETISGGQQIGNYYGLLSDVQSAYWSTSYFLNNSDIVGARSRNTFPHPNPFYMNRFADLGSVFLPLDSDDESAEADLYIYDVSMHLLQALHKPTIMDRQLYVVWKPLKDMSTRLGSGVYIYQIKTAKKSITGKITIIND
jgi:hypothetical protein